MVVNSEVEQFSITVVKRRSRKVDRTDPPLSENPTLRPLVPLQGAILFAFGSFGVKHGLASRLAQPTHRNSLVNIKPRQLDSQLSLFWLQEFPHSSRQLALPAEELATVHF